MSYLHSRRLGWDTETTGPNPLEARIVTAAVIVRGAGHPDRAFSYLINPGIDIPPETTEVHGVTNEKAQSEGLNPAVALEDLADKLAAAIRGSMPTVAFNTSFDWTVLNCDLTRNGLRTMADRFLGDPVTLIDPHVIDREYIPRIRGKGQRKLKPTCGRYGVQLEDWHTAEADALAALLIADAQFARFPHLQQYTPPELYAAQQVWRADQQAGLQDWFRTTATPEQGGDPEKVIDGSWPLVPAKAVA